jgi:ATP-binding cassette, subfamily A (ABC1), member 3
LGQFFLANTFAIIGINVVIGVAFFIISVLIDTRMQSAYRRQDTRQPSWYPRYLDADNDVLREAQAMEADNDTNSQFSVKVKSLMKVYGNGYPAVNAASFGIQKNEVLGLLGPNGAGKSTTFSVCTMENAKTQGEVRIMGTPLEQFDT